MARKFFYVCAGMLMLALSYHFGFTNATAQTAGNPVVSMPTEHVAVTANGDLYWSPSGSVLGPFQNVGNLFSGPPTPAQRATWGQLKSRYAPTPQTPTSQTNDR